MTQGRIGYAVQNTLQKHLWTRKIDTDAIAVVGRVVIGADHPESLPNAASQPVTDFLAKEEVRVRSVERPDHALENADQ